ncbi:BMP family ABC transporter substrate-binding protein [Rhodopseudomonas sp. B29]|uniref:BMP family ABC transporter substrate-binding protein n=1 Tax=Rhodopseudomonas sp. B29 TaxID=95607 RepID=UPI00034D0F14
MNPATIAALILAAACAVLPAQAQDKPAPDKPAGKLKIGYVYLGAISDAGWGAQQEQARKAVVKEFGDRIETTTLEKISDGLEAERYIEQLARAGNKLIFATSPAYTDEVMKLAKKYPGVKFELATGTRREANVSTYTARFYEGRYVEGTIAAKMSKSGVIGYVAAMPTPDVLAGINATMLAAQKIRPDIKLNIAWTNVWSDPAKEAQAARTLIDQGADVIMQATGSTAPMQVAGEKHVLAFGQASDMIKTAPKAQLTAIVDDWAPHEIGRVHAVLDNTWKSEDFRGGLKDKTFTLAPFTNMPDDVKQLAADTEAGIVSGAIKPFACPITAQDGNAIDCKGAEHLEDGQIATMNFLVKGIDAALPGK